MKCQSAKNPHLYFSEPNVTSSNHFFCPDSPKHKDFLFNFINKTEKLQILTFKPLKQQFILLFNLKND